MKLAVSPGPSVIEVVLSVRVICEVIPSLVLALMNRTAAVLSVYVEVEVLTEVMVTVTVLVKSALVGIEPKEMLAGSNVAVTDTTALRSIRPPPMARTLLLTSVLGRFAELMSADLTCSGLQSG